MAEYTTHDGNGNRPPEPGGQTPYREVPYAMSAEERHKSFAEEDKRWSEPKQIRDWLVLAFFMLVMVFWSLIVYFLEPGLRDGRLLTGGGVLP